MPKRYDRVFQLFQSFASLRGLLSDHHPLDSLWRRIAPLFVGRVQTDRQAIAGHYDFSNEFYLKFMDPNNRRN